MSLCYPVVVDHSIVYPSSIYKFRLPFWYLLISLNAIKTFFFGNRKLEKSESSFLMSTCLYSAGNVQDYCCKRVLIWLRICYGVFLIWVVQRIQLYEKGCKYSFGWMRLIYVFYYVNGRMSSSETPCMDCPWFKMTMDLSTPVTELKISITFTDI